MPSDTSREESEFPELYRIVKTSDVDELLVDGWALWGTPVACGERFFQAVVSPEIALRRGMLQSTKRDEEELMLVEAKAAYREELKKKIEKANTLRFTKREPQGAA